MRVKILIEFDVDTDEENIAKSAASQAAYDYLTFCTVSGMNTECDEVEVEVDGCEEPVTVRLGDDHE